jgi:hypothetical protein
MCGWYHGASIDCDELRPIRHVISRAPLLKCRAVVGRSFIDCRGIGVSVTVGKVTR